jgi:putative phosphoribosyl transferase
VVIMSETHIREGVDGPVVRFPDRLAAGRALREFIDPRPDPEALVFALPRGGVPVARPLADALGSPLLPLPVRKLPIPTSPEMGFGAITLDGTVTLNRPVMRSFGISERVGQTVADEVLTELQRRAQAYPGSWPLPDIAGRDIWLVDDGLATGLSMVAAAGMLRAREPASLSMAVVAAPRDSLTLLAESVDAEWCLFAQQQGPFAVASYYYDFHDLTDDEVRKLLAA